MISRNSKLFLTALAILLVAALVISGTVTPFTPAAPPAWSRAHVGMQREAVVAIVGQPQAGGHDKTIDVWYVTGAIGTRQMFVGYDSSNNAIAVTEGIYWPLAKRFIPKRKDR